ncbi:MAG TPA: XdhC family protein [Chloroflexia bacterium]|nr:XdhC family protein [Chloroflexia bacterium]
MSMEFYAKASELLNRGEPFATAQIVRAEKPTSAKPGDKAIITTDGTLFGWVGGSCAQPTVIREALKALSEGEPRLIRLTPNPLEQIARPGMFDLPLTCFSGGTLEIYIEPQVPAPRLMIVGSLPVAQALLRLAKVMGYHVTVVDPDTKGNSPGEADEILSEINELKSKITPYTYVVVASHGNYDEIALEQVLRAGPAYVALVASKTRATSVLEYLRMQGVTESALATLKCPAGLDIHATQAQEIALSILAEIVQRRHQHYSIQPNKAPISLPVVAEALDPVCGMTVTIAESKFSYAYNGQTYYFCCPACKKLFSKEPEKYLVKPAPSGEAVDPICGMQVQISTAKYMSEYEGRLYYFCAAGCKLSFDKAPASFIQTAGT